VSAGLEFCREQSNSFSLAHPKSKVACHRTSLDSDVFGHDTEFDVGDRPRIESVFLPSQDPWSSCLERTSSISVDKMIGCSNFSSYETPLMRSSEALQRFVDEIHHKTTLGNCKLLQQDNNKVESEENSKENIASTWSVMSHKETPKPLAVLASESRKREACELTDVKQRIAEMLGKGSVVKLFGAFFYRLQSFSVLLT